MTESNHLPKHLPLSVDAHIDIPWVMYRDGRFNLGKDNQGIHSQTDFPRMIKGKLDTAFFALYLSDKKQKEIGFANSMLAIRNQIKALEEQPGLKLVDSWAGATKAIGDYHMPIFLGLEGGRLIGHNLNFLTELRARHVRYLTATHNTNIDWCDSATDEPRIKGITQFGEEVVKKCNELDILMDISHVSEESAKAILFHSEKPVIATHSGCKTITNHPRNLSDELMKRIADSGGIVCIPLAKKFVENLGIFLRHVAHAVSIVGHDHVGIGSDLDGAEMIGSMNSVEDWKLIATGLLRFNYTKEQLQGILGTNLLRVIG